MSRIPPSSRQQFVFIILFGAIAAGLIYVVWFILPRQAIQMWYLEGWTYTVAGVFWLIERTVRNLLGRP